MDGQRFDELARGLAGARSRRDVLKALTGAIVAGAGTVMVQRGATFAQESCTTDDDCDAEEICCAGACRAIECCIDEDDPNARCPEGTRCFEGVCDPVDGACTTDAECADDGICCAGTCRAIECC
ncbi:MAG: twin-arginine translocation signal domain-containing protein, partial [Chloroflexota bacterium]|nr:twin-arginine translocation signal domain-containing protein [Chloroflexota bacterium]